MGNKNALKHGRYTAEAVAERRAAREAIHRSREIIRTMLLTTPEI